jgi:hypothetical protein
MRLGINGQKNKNGDDMKELFKDYCFNQTIQLISVFILIAFFIYQIKSCEVEKIHRAVTIEQLKQTGIR